MVIQVFVGHRKTRVTHSDLRIYRTHGIETMKISTNLFSLDDSGSWEQKLHGSGSAKTGNASIMVVIRSCVIQICQVCQSLTNGTVTAVNAWSR